MWKKALTFVLVTAFGPGVFADTLVVASGRFHLTWEEQDVPERAEIVKDKLIYAARENGWDVVEADTTCREPACLDRLLTDRDADDAVYVKVDENVGEYTMDVHFARRESFSIDFTGAFPEALTVLRDKVKKALAPSRSKAASPQPEPVAAPQPSKETEETKPAPPPPPPARSATRDTDGIAPTPFWVSLGVTGGTLVAYVATGIAGEIKWEEVKAKDLRTKSDKNSLKDIQTANRILLSVTLAGAVTTGVLYLLTDFDEGADGVGSGNPIASVRPVVLKDGGGIGLEGTF